MGFFSSIISAGVKTVALPLVIVADVITAGKSEASKKHVESIQEDISDAFFGE